MYKISIILPVYNSEKTIKRCLDSILKQTYSNLEIIIVNDGSTDNTLDIICNMQEDSRIRIVSIENKGVSHARNVGLDKATGDLVTFVDSDDYIECNMYQYLVDIMNKYDADISHCGYNNVIDNKVVSFTGKNNGKEFVQNTDEALECLISGKLFSGGIWNKLYKMKLFNNIRFVEDIHFNEDVLINYYLFKNSKTSVFADKALYNYVANFSGATHSANSIHMGEDCKTVADIIEKDSKGTSYYLTAQYKRAYCAIVLYRAYLYANDKENKNKKVLLLEEIKQYKKLGVYKNRNDKLSVFLFVYFPHLYRAIYKIYDRNRVKHLDPT